MEGFTALHYHLYRMNTVQRIGNIYRENGFRSLSERVWKYILVYNQRSSRLTKSLFGRNFHQKLYMYPKLGYWPNIREPRTFNEKILHRKLYTDNELFALVEDKYRVREYVEERVGNDVLPEVYHVTDDPETIPFDSLPAEYVVKPTHLSNASVLLVDENDTPDPESIREQCRKWLNSKWGINKGEYWYDKITPRILIEERLHNSESEIPRDFKMYVFNGKLEYIHVDFERFGNSSRRFFDREWNPQEFTKNEPLGPEIKKPMQLDTMIGIAEKLGEPFDFIRVDLYHLDNGQVIFGEMTVAPASGGSPFTPREYDFKFGSLW